MLLHRIQVENWRSLRNPVALDDLDPGLNLVFGPNETGKSTVLDALCRGFFDRHKTAGDDMLARQPWGSKLGPRVVIEFSVGSDRYRLTKRFLSEASSELARQLGGQWERVADASAADEKIVELVAGRQSGAGLTKPEHWGLGQVLWAQQGLAAQLDVGESQQNRLREALRLTLATADVEAIEAALRARYEEIYTPTGKLRGEGARGAKTRAEVLVLEDELEQAKAARDEAQRQYAEADQLVFDLDTAAAQQASLQAQLAQARALLATRRGERDALREAESQYARLSAAFQEAHRAWQALNDTVNQIAQGEKDLAAAQTQAAELEAAGRAAEAQVALRQDALRQAQQEQDALAQAARQVEDALEAVGRELACLDAQEKIAGLRTKLEQGRALARQVEQVTQGLRALRAPDARQMAALRKLHQELQKARTELEAAGLTLEFHPQQPALVTPEIDGQPQPAREVTDALTLRAARALGLEIAGVGRVTVRSGARDVQELLAQVTKLEKKWAHDTAGLGAATIEALEDLAARRVALEKEEQMLRGQAGETQPDAAARLEAELEELEREAEALRGLSPSAESAEQMGTDPLCSLRLGRPHLVDADPLPRPEMHRGSVPVCSEDSTNGDRPCEGRPSLQQQKKALESQRQKLRAQSAAAEAAARQADRELTQGRQQVSQVQQQRSAAKATADQIARQLAALRERDGWSDPERRTRLAAAGQERDLAQQRLERLAKPALSDLDEELARLERKVDELQQRYVAEERRIGGLEAAIARLGAKGLYSQLAELREAVVHLEGRCARTRLTAEATRLLWDTVAAQKQSVFEALLRPVQTLVLSGLHQLIGPGYDAVHFDQRLHPQQVHAARYDTNAGTDLLSFGTREQLVLLVRLALARLLGREGQRQCVVLDDALVNADEARQQRALAILEEAARETQIIIFTCHPTAYAGLGGAKRYDLAALARAKREDGTSNTEH